MKPSLFAALLSAICLSACANGLWAEFSPHAQSLPLSQDYVLGEIRTAADGDVIFQQNFSTGRLAVLEGDLISPEPRSGEFHFNEPAGTYLQPGRLRTNDAIYVAYCSIELQTESRPLIGGWYPTRICFVDTDNSGEFDLAFESAVWRDSGSIETRADRYDFRTSAFDGTKPFLDEILLVPPIEYSITDQVADATGHFDVFYYSTGPDTGRLKINSDVGGNRGGIISGGMRFGPNYPQTVQLQGLTFEVISSEGGVLTYRIVRGLSEGFLTGF